MPSSEANGLAPCRTRRRFYGNGETHLGIEEHVAVSFPFHDAVDFDTREVRICCRSEAQVNQHQPLVHATYRTS